MARAALLVATAVVCLACAAASNPSIADVRSEIAKLKADMAALWSLAGELALPVTPPGEVAGGDAPLTPHPSGRGLQTTQGPVLRLQVRRRQRGDRIG
jgi:hypothetical protein